MLSATVLIVEDDHDLRGVLVRSLRESGFAAQGVASGGELIEWLRRDGGGGGRGARAVDRGGDPDLLVVDIGLPDTDGRDLCQGLRAQGVTAPVLFLTARDAVSDRLAGFAAGGDDYLIKPFDLDELIARLHALRRRSAGEPKASLGDIELDPTAHAVVSAGQRVALTPTEFRLLGKLAAHVGAVVRRHELLGAAWPAGAVVHDNTLDVYIARLRRKLAALPGAPLIETAHGVGYSIQR
jgi:two-component system, OmpR family, response regulator